MSSFIKIDAESHFPLQNLPFGVFSRKVAPSSVRVGVAIGNHVLDLSCIARAGLFRGPHLQADAEDCFSQGSLNNFMAKGRPAWREARSAITKMLGSSEGSLQDEHDLLREALVPMDEVCMHLPARIGDYTDFYASREHATNVGVMFRGKDNALNANWLHLPVGYHGRSSSIVVSGTPVRRPKGQILPSGASSPAFGPSAVLDFELEMGCFIGPGNAQGEAIGVDDASSHIFGMVLLNDWSARDIQKWEYVPLGPFNGKNWATTISPWVVTLDALEPFRCEAPKQELAVLPYLSEVDRHSFDINLEVSIQAKEASPSPSLISSSNLKHLYWTLPQMVAHHTVGGCNLNPGDLLGTGTISSDSDAGLGSMLELSWGGTRTLKLASGEERKFLLDHDSVVLSGYCQGEGYRVGFGDCTGTVLPAL